MIMVQVYMRLSERFASKETEFLVLNLHPDYCLDELQTLCRGMKPKRVHISVFDDGSAYMWEQSF